MDIYQIIWQYNSSWSMERIIWLGIGFTLLCICIGLGIYMQKIKISQALASITLYVFWGIVLGATVYNRATTVRQYELIPLWSWKEVLIRHNWPLLREILLNCILLMPMGILIPIALDRTIRIKYALVVGIIVSAIIECSQLMFMKGLFEWDDILHNGLGCMVGCWIANKMLNRKRESILERKTNNEYI